MTNEERQLAIYCLKASNDFYSEVCDECTEFSNCDHFKMDELMSKVIKELEQKRKIESWIHFTDDRKDYVACSCCGYGEEGEVLLEDKTPFCPICGARLEVDE